MAYLGKTMLLARLTKALLVSVALLYSANLFASPTISGDAKAGFRVKAEGYEAKVGPDGYLSHLRIAGQEFLLPDVDISRGTYFHQGVVIKFEKTAATDAAIESEGPLASVRYAFADNTLTWTVTNRSKGQMHFFAILPSTVSVAADAKGNFAAMPSKQSWAESSWFSENAKLTFRTGGPATQWAWHRDSTVMDVLLAPGEKRVIELAVSKPTDADRAGIKSIRPELGDLRITSPLNLQVFQRATRNEGKVRISGKVLVPADTIQVRFTGKDVDGKPLKDGWQDAGRKADDGSFSTLVTLPAGGWFKADFRALLSGKEVTTTQITQFGIGEVFVGAGQSNSTNCGGLGSKLPTDGRTESTSGMVSSFDGKSWRIANDPQRGAHDNSQGGSFWPAFGDAMAARYHVPIGVAVTGHGGTSINQWKSGGELFNWTLGRLQQLNATVPEGSQGFRALLWHQGESDAGANMKGEAYADGLGTIIREMRRQDGHPFVWFVAKVSFRPGKPPYASVCDGQKTLWDTKVALEGPDTDAMVGDLRDNGGKGIHFSKKGLKVHGEAWAKYVGEWLDKEIKQ